MNTRFGGVRVPMRRRVLLGIVLLIGGPIISTTLATTLTITGTSGRTAVEFGQGSQIAIGCDTTINTAITELWETSTTRFRVEKIVLTGLNLTAVDTATANDAGCGNRDLKISVVDTATGQLQLGNGDTATAVTISFGNNGTAGARTSQNLFGGSVAVDIASAGLSLTNATVTYTLPNPLLTSLGATRNPRSLDPGTIARVALETNN